MSSGVDKIRSAKISQYTKILLFKTYCRSKINHCIPLLTATGCIKESWEGIRKVIFQVVLEYNTLPIELRNIYGIGFYTVMVKPILKLNTHEYYEKEKNSGKKDECKRLYKKHLRHL